MKSLNLDEFKNKKIALVFSGGVVKAAAWHLGISLALEELGFSLKSNRPATQNTGRPLEISTYVGSSAGAMVGTYLASGYTPNEIIRSTLRLDKKGLKPITYKEIFSLKKPKISSPKFRNYHPLDGLPFIVRQTLKPILNIPGFFSTEGVKDYLLKNVITEDSFESYEPDLFIIATQLDHSRKVIFSKYNYPNPSHDSTSVYYTGTSVSHAAAASMAVPPFYTPYPIQNQLTKEIDYYIDGEIRETLSTHVAVDNGCDVIISSWTHTPYHYHDEIGTLANYGLSAIAIQSIYLMIQKKIISSRADRAKAKDIIDTVNDYMKGEKFNNKDRRNITAILEKKLNVNTRAKLIDIYPDHHDYKLFFSNAFSLSPKTSSYVVEAAYKRTMDVFQKKEWL